MARTVLVVWVLVGCSEPPRVDGVLAELVGTVDVAAGTLTLERVDTRSLTEIPISGTTVGLFTSAATVGNGEHGCQRAGAFCADVTLRSFFDNEEIHGAAVELTSISDVANVAFGDSTAAGCSATLGDAIGLWTYGDLAPGAAATRTWKFANPSGTSFTFRGRVVGDLDPSAACPLPAVEACGNGFEDDGDGLTDCEDADCSGVATMCGGAGPARVYFATNSAGGVPGVMYVMDADGGNRTALFDSGSATLQISLDLASHLVAANGWLFWRTFNGPLLRARMNGSSGGVLGFGNESRGLAVDVTRAKLYWGNFFGINASNFDGSGQQAPVLFSALMYTIRIDEADEHLYFTSNPDFDGNYNIYRVDIDGWSNVVELASNVQQVLALDEVNGKIYYATATTIDRMSLDGSGAETVMTIAGVTELAVDSATGKLFVLVAPGTGNSQIVTANLDGSGAMTILDLAGVTSMAIAP